VTLHKSLSSYRNRLKPGENKTGRSSWRWTSNFLRALVQIAGCRTALNTSVGWMGTTAGNLHQSPETQMTSFAAVANVKTSASPCSLTLRLRPTR
jgi:hypothetical protein